MSFSLEAAIKIASLTSQGSASTKTRAEVRGGGKKPFAQKGTGNARQGSRTTPLKPGGGVVFGPKVTHFQERDLADNSCTKISVHLSGL